MSALQQQQNPIATQKVSSFVASPAAATCGSSRPVSRGSVEESERAVGGTDIHCQGPPECNNAHVEGVNGQQEKTAVARKAADQLSEQRQTPEEQEKGQDWKPVSLQEQQRNHNWREGNGEIGIQKSAETKGSVTLESSVKSDRSASSNPLTTGLAGAKVTYSGGKSAEPGVSVKEFSEGAKKSSRSLQHQPMRVPRRGSVGSALQGSDRALTGPQAVSGRKQQRGRRGGSQAAPRASESDSLPAHIHKTQPQRSLEGQSADGGLVTKHASLVSAPVRGKLETHEATETVHDPTHRKASGYLRVEGQPRYSDADGAPAPAGREGLKDPAGERENHEPEGSPSGAHSCSSQEGKLVDPGAEAARRKKKKPSVQTQQSGSQETAEKTEPATEISSLATGDHVTEPEVEPSKPACQGKSLSVHEGQVHAFFVDAAHVNTTDAGRCRN